MKTEHLVILGLALVALYLFITHEMNASAIAASPTGGASSFLSSLSPGPGQPGTTVTSLGGS
jgi:hypothetical protein